MTIDTTHQTMAPSTEESQADSVSPVPEAEERDSIVDGEERSVDPRSVRVNRITAIGTILAVAAQVFIGVGIGWLLGGIPTWLYSLLMAGWALLFGSITLFGYKYPALHFRHLSYRVDETGVRIKHGVLWRQIVSIPTSRVQHTDVTQGPLQRRYDLATLTVHTAGTQAASIDLAGLRHDVALRLRDHLLPGSDDDAV